MLGVSERAPEPTEEAYFADPRVMQVYARFGLRPGDPIPPGVPVGLFLRRAGVPPPEGFNLSPSRFGNDPSRGHLVTPGSPWPIIALGAGAVGGVAALPAILGGAGAAAGGGGAAGGATAAGGGAVAAGGAGAAGGAAATGGSILGTLGTYAAPASAILSRAAGNQAAGKRADEQSQLSRDQLEQQRYQTGLLAPRTRLGTASRASLAATHVPGNPRAGLETPEYRALAQDIMNQQMQQQMTGDDPNRGGPPPLAPHEGSSWGDKALSWGSLAATGLNAYNQAQGGGGGYQPGSGEDIPFTHPEAAAPMPPILPPAAAAPPTASAAALPLLGDPIPAESTSLQSQANLQQTKERAELDAFIKQLQGQPELEPFASPSMRPPRRDPSRQDDEDLYGDAYDRDQPWGRR